MHLEPFQSVLSSVALHVHCSQRRSAYVFIRITIIGQLDNNNNKKLKLRACTNVQAMAYVSKTF